MKFALESGLPKSFVCSQGLNQTPVVGEEAVHATSMPISCLVLFNESIHRIPKIKRVFTPYPQCISDTFLERLPHLAGGEVARTREAVEEHALDVDVAVVQRTPELQQDIFARDRRIKLDCDLVLVLRDEEASVWRN